MTSDGPEGPFPTILGITKYFFPDSPLMSKTTLKIEGMMCEGCVKSVREGLEKVPGVSSVDVNLKKGTAAVQHDGASEEDLLRAVVDAGFRASVKHGLFS